MNGAIIAYSASGCSDPCQSRGSACGTKVNISHSATVSSEVAPISTRIRTSSVRSMASVSDGVGSALASLSSGALPATMAGAGARKRFVLATETAPRASHVRPRKLQFAHQTFGLRMSLLEKVYGTCGRQAAPSPPSQAFFGQPFLQHVDAVGAPEQLAIENTGRHAEHTAFVGRTDNRRKLLIGVAVEILAKAFRRDADLAEQRNEIVDVLDVDLAIPESWQQPVVQRALAAQIG